MPERLLYTAAAPFEAARRVDILPDGHRSRNLHGHSFLARLRAELPKDWASYVGAECDTLRARLQNIISPLDYSLLNDNLRIPTDENLARWVGEAIDLQQLELVGIQSTKHGGADLDSTGAAHIWRRYRFEAAHQLPNVPPGHPCGRMHGHGFEVILHVQQQLEDNPMGVDYDHIDQCWAPIAAQLDHTCLNDIAGLENPTSESLAAWIWSKIRDDLPQLSWVTVYETVTAGCHFDGKDYRIWKEQRFESALQLENVPKEDKRANLHGHSYLLRLHLTAPLDPVMCWTVDYGDVKETFKPAYAQLDHHALHELPGIASADSASVAHWIKNQVADNMPYLDRIDLFETPGCGVLLCWGDNAPALPA